MKMDTSSLIDVSVCIVTWNNMTVIQDCLSSLFDQTKGLSFEVILVDNNSSDGTVEIVRVKYPCVKVYPQEENLGFARANNLALSESRGRYILFLNPDTVLHSEVLAYCRDKMDADLTIGIMGCRLVSKDGSIQLTCASSFPTPWNIFCEGIFIHRISKKFPWLSLFSSRSLEHWDHLSAREVQTISGAFMFCRKSVLDRIGGFDAGYFMYGEDIDLCGRIREAGYKVWYDPSHLVTHYGGASTSYQPSDFSKIWQFRSNYTFLRKHFGKVRAYSFRGVILAVSVFRMVMLMTMYPLLCFSSIPANKYIVLNIKLLKEAIRMKPNIGSI